MTAGLITSVLRGRTLALAGLALAAMVSTNAYAGTIYTSDLSQVHPSGSPTGNNIQPGFDGTVTGITNTSSGGILGYNFDYMSALSAHNTGAGTNAGGNVQLKLAPTDVDTMDTQDHGYFLALDSVYQTSAIDVSFKPTGLGLYTVTFDYAATQQRGYFGTSTDKLRVALNGGQATDTSVISLNNPASYNSDHNFSGYFAVTDTFNVTSLSTQTLSFLAIGTPNGSNGSKQDPAFTLLDNINISTQSTPPPMTPEPSSLILLSTGLMGLGGFIRRRSMKA